MVFRSCHARQTVCRHIVREPVKSFRHSLPRCVDERIIVYGGRNIFGHSRKPVFEAVNVVIIRGNYGFALCVYVAPQIDRSRRNTLRRSRSVRDLFFIRRKALGKTARIEKIRFDNRFSVFADKSVQIVVSDFEVDRAQPLGKVV